ncbi:MAG: YfiT family bacillithiol transferase [Gemmatimonadaceae bacterium]
MSDDLRYPTGKFSPPADYTPELRARYVDIVANTPAALRAAVLDLSDAQLDEPYRPGGWTVRQVVHHVPDSHVNAYVRWKLALTEHVPTIKPYDEAAWALLEDARSTAVDTSLTFLDVVHDRWLRIIRAMHDADFQREFVHPDHGKRTLNWMLAMYAWHGPHHVAHIVRLRERKGWT